MLFKLFHNNSCLLFSLLCWPYAAKHWSKKKPFAWLRISRPLRSNFRTLFAVYRSSFLKYSYSLLFYLKHFESIVLEIWALLCSKIWRIWDLMDFHWKSFRKNVIWEKSSSIVLLLFTRLNSILSVLKFPLARCGHIRKIL